MIKVLLSEACMLFFGQITEYVIFDVIPTEYVYPLIFYFEDDSAYSEEAEKLGYVSRFFIINTGSITIFFILRVLLHVFLWLLTKICKQGKIYNWAQRKLESFQWAGWYDFFDDIYLNIVISVQINTSMLTMSNASEIGNNTFGLFVAISIVVIPII